MNKLDIRIAVAELMGWKHPHPRSQAGMMHPPNSKALDWPPCCDDLNYVRELEASLTDEEFARYMQNLGILIAERTGKANRLCDRLPLHAKAEWRTETYLRLKGKWKE